MRREALSIILMSSYAVYGMDDERVLSQLATSPAAYSETNSNSRNLDNSSLLEYVKCQTGKLESSINSQVFESAIQDNSMTPEQLLERGKRYYCERNDEQAYVFLNSVLTHQQQDPKAIAWANVYLGHLRYEKKEYRPASSHAKKAISMRHHDDRKLACNAMLLLSKILYMCDQYSDSHTWLRKIVRDYASDDPESAAEARLLLGMQYENGEISACKPMYPVAQTYYESAANQRDNLSISLAAKLCLCDMTYAKTIIPEEDNHARKNKIALDYCNEVIEQGKPFPSYIAKARLRRAMLYKEGGYGIQADALRSQEDLKYVINQNDDPISRDTAMRLDLSSIDLVRFDE